MKEEEEVPETVWDFLGELPEPKDLFKEVVRSKKAKGGEIL